MPNLKRGEFVVEKFAGEEQVMFRLRAEELGLLESRMGGGALQIMQQYGMRLASNVVFVGLLYRHKDNAKAWTPKKAERAINKHVDLGGNMNDILKPTMTIVNDFLGLGAKDDDEDEDEDDSEGLERGQTGREDGDEGIRPFEKTAA